MSSSSSGWGHNIHKQTVAKSPFDQPHIDENAESAMQQPGFKSTHSASSKVHDVSSWRNEPGSGSYEHKIQKKHVYVQQGDWYMVSTS